MRLPAFLHAARRRPIRSVRTIAVVLLLFLPVALTTWAASVVVPIAIEARQAAGQVFVTPVVREHFVDTPGTRVPEIPGSPTIASTTTTGIVSIPTATPLPNATPTPPGPTPTPYPAWDSDRPINILLLGVDARVGEEGPPRSDTMIIVRIDPVSKRVDMLSIPRDLLVEIPGYSATKINAAYPYGEMNSDIPGGGPTLAAQTVEYNFGIRIDYFAEVDIVGMEKVVDTLGGVVVDVPGIIKDDQYPTGDYGYTRVYFTPGLQLMDGQTAVRFSRTRHGDGDFARQARQQQVLMAIRDRAIDTGAITKLPELLGEVGASVRTDLSLRQMFALARLAQEINRNDIYTHSMAPYVQVSWIDGGYYLVGNWDAIRAMVSDFPSDSNAQRPLESSAPVETPVVSPTIPPRPVPTATPTTPSRLVP
ncbi:MAG TPA: LCP family protein [Thermomicrobiales bacterium]|jgi:LCP family protein required for cell wall assembly|nr:LCP family protein [Thermomicrobiales bacterium]